MSDSINHKSLRHIPALDGIRGIAILLVLFYHCTIIKPNSSIDDYYYMFGHSLWVGVDLFFVLSGFLITRILLNTKTSNSYFSSFYIRRALRIFPLYYLFVALVIFVVPNINYFKSLGVEQVHHPWWYWTYLSNFLAAKQAALRHLFLGPTWSLAIEEQFYLVWPLIVWLCSLKWLTRTCLLLIIFPAILRAVLHLHYHIPANSIYVLTFTRMDTIATGALIACLLQSSCSLNAIRKAGMWVFSIVTIILIPFAFEGLINKRQPAMILYGYSLVTMFFGSLVLIVNSLSQTSILHRFLTLKPLLIAGKYSYGVYLFNRPLIPIVERSVFNPRNFPMLLDSHIPGQLIFTAIVITFSFILAYISWHSFERWFLMLKRYAPAGAAAKE